MTQSLGLASLSHFVCMIHQTQKSDKGESPSVPVR